MINKDLLQTANNTLEIAEEKWRLRLTFTPSDAPEFTFDHIRAINPLRAVPNSWCKLVNSVVRPCPACKQKGIVTSRWHLWVKHNIRLSNPTYILTEEIVPLTTADTLQELLTRLPPNTFQGYTKKNLQEKPKRSHIRISVSPIIQTHLNNYNHMMLQLLTR